MTVEEVQKPIVAVIGAGLSGLCTAIELKSKLKIDPDIYEINDDVGGTWIQNTYPGCSCDLPSHVYTLKSDLNSEWSNSFSSQSEILEYMKNVAKKHKIYEKTRFRTEVLRASWVEERNQWKLELRDLSKSSDSVEELETVYYDVLFCGVGGLRIPNIPSEFKQFKGQVVHTASWDHSIDFENKRVALVGSGSSACQVTAFLSEKSSKLISYQRSVPWVLPRGDFNYANFVKLIFHWVPFALLLYRFYLYLLGETLYIALGYPDSFLTKRFVAGVIRQRNKELESLGRPDLIPLLQPTYRLGCKRIIFSSDYLRAIAKPNVTLVQSPIKEIKDKTIVTEDGRSEEVDILVLGTGYKTQEGILGNIEILGNEGQSLTELWKTNLPQFYKSTITHGFPNFFMLLGPTTILGHHSVLLMIETQVKFAITCIRELLIKRKYVTVEPKEEAQSKYMAKLRQDLKGTVWTTSCKSWYKNESGEITSIYPNTVARFKWTLDKFNVDDYVLPDEKRQ